MSASNSVVFDSDKPQRAIETLCHRRLGCPLALHKIQIYPLSMTAEAGDFCHEPARDSPASLFTLN